MSVGFQIFCSLLKLNETPVSPNEIKQGTKKITSFLRVIMFKITRFTGNIAALSLLVLVGQVNAGTLRPINVHTEPRVLNGLRAYTGWGRHPDKETSINNAKAKAKDAVLGLAKEACKKAGGGNGKLESYQIFYAKRNGFYSVNYITKIGMWHHYYNAELLGVCRTS